MARLFTFPDPVNEVSARLVATGVVAMALTFMATGSSVVLIIMTYGFWARVLTGPTLSPLGQLATRVLTPLIAEQRYRFVAGAPKRFAQGIGAAFTTLALVGTLLNAPAIAYGLIAALTVAAGLEAFAGYCLGCSIYGLLIRSGLRPAADCPECADISERVEQRLVAAGR